MRKFLLASTLAAIGGLSGFASDYVPMIQEGRVWEYTGYSTEYNGAAFHYMKFDGTETVAGTEYHRFVQFKSLVFGEDRKLASSNNSVSQVYYLREEPGKVFVLCEKNSGMIVNQEILSGDPGAGSPEYSEFKVYDFTLPDGATWEYPSAAGCTGIDEDMSLDVKWGTPVEIDGEQCRVMGFSNLSVMGEDDILYFIEGIGTTCNGILPAPNMDNVSGVWDNTKEASMQSWLNRVFDSEGNVIYNGKESTAPPANYGYAPMIREDRVWEYFSYEYKTNYTECALERYGFTDSMEYNGHTYRLCELLSRTTWRTPDGVFSDVLMAEDIKEESVGAGYHYLRQEGSKVYLFVDPLWESFQYSPAPYDEVTSFDPISTPDMLLFDFSAVKGDVVKSVMNSYDQFIGMVLTEAEVTDTEEIEVGSTLARRLKLSNVSGTDWNNELTIYIDSEWLEGVGNIGNGSMVAFGGIQWPKPTCYCGDGGYFNNLYDLEGNVIYKGADIRVGTNGVNVVSTDSETGKSGAIYDLMGRRVERVLPGSVYVRDGKKFVGK